MSTDKPGDIVDIGRLSRTIPIFPLSGARQLPRALLPLNIFEPRYLAMTRDALASAQAGGWGLIGMIQPSETPRGREALSETYRPDVYRVGCVGEIAPAAEAEGGRVLITLRGLCRFAVVDELQTDTPYRQVAADYTDFADDAVPAADGIADRERLLQALRAFCERHN